MHRGGLVLVSHDRHVLDRVTKRGSSSSTVGAATCTRAATWRTPQACVGREAQAVSQERIRRNLARSELAWLRLGAPAWTHKLKARIASATAIVEGRPEAARPAAMATSTSGSERPASVTTRSNCTVSVIGSAPGRGCSAAWSCRWIPASGWASSGRTAPASRPCSTSSPARWPCQGHARRGGRDRRDRCVRPAWIDLDPTMRVDPQAVAVPTRLPDSAACPIPRTVLVRRRRPTGADRPAVGR